MARTIQNLYVTGGQTFRISINGLNPVTEVKLFFDGVLVPSSQVKQVLANETGSDTFVGPIFNVPGYTDKLITNLNGAITFDFTYTDSIVEQNYTTEEAYYKYAQLNSGPKSLIVIDAATAAAVIGSLSDTVDSDNLTQTLRKAKCHAFGVVQLSYGIQFTEMKPAGTTVYYDSGSLGDGPDPSGSSTDWGSALAGLQGTYGYGAYEASLGFDAVAAGQMGTSGYAAYESSLGFDEGGGSNSGPDSGPIGGAEGMAGDW